MALPSTGVWEVRSTGAATNGGGYNSSRSGATTDYSQQNSAQVTFTDLVIGAGNSLTSVLFPFTSLHIGNFVQITGGTGFTTGIYEVTAVASAVATLDRSPGTLASSGGAGKLGGALAKIQDIASVIVGLNTAWVKGAFNVASAINFAPTGTELLPITVACYSSTRGDGGFATWTCTNGAASPTVTLGGAGTFYRNFKVDGAGLAAIALSISGQYAENCWGLGGTANGIVIGGNGSEARRCKGSGSGTVAGDAGFVVSGNGAQVMACSATGNTGSGFQGTAGVSTWVDCLASGNSRSGFEYGATGSLSMRLYHCTAVNNTLSGFNLATATSGTFPVYLADCLFANNAAYGIRSAVTDYSGAASLALLFHNNAFYSNALGNYSQVPAGTEDILLTVDPFSDFASGDYSLNNATLGGTLLRFTGDSGGIGLLGTSAETTTSQSDIGASQAGPATGAGGGVGDAPSLRSLWRELTNEHSTTVIPDTVIDLYLNGGLQALNRRVHYHLTDTETAITLVAGQQEYALPQDTVMVAWIQWNGKEIVKSDTDEWRRRDIDWRNAKAGVPAEWAHYRDRIILYPPPDGNAVAVEPNPLIRYVSTPPDFSASGAEQLTLQDRRLPVYYAVAEWASAHPDSALATIRAEAFLQRFTEEAEAVKADYLARLVGR